MSQFLTGDRIVGLGKPARQAKENIMENSQNTADSTDKILALIAHLGYFSGVGYFFAPLIIYFMKKDSPFVASHAKQAMIYQGATFVLMSLLGLGGFVVSLLTAGIAAILVVPALFIFGILLVVPSVIAAIKVCNGEEYSYPGSGAWAQSL